MHPCEEKKDGCKEFFTLVCTDVQVYTLFKLSCESLDETVEKSNLKHS